MAWSTACVTPAELPYDASHVIPAEVPHHPLAVALVRLVDARPSDEVASGGDRYRYRGGEYRGTQLDRLGVEPMREITHAVGHHLARARVFRQVLVVARAAPQEAELILEGRLVRLRGYVEDPEDDAPLVRVVGESALDFEVRTRPGGSPVARFEVGFSFHDERPRGSEPSPWAVAAEALRPALDQLVASARRAVFADAPPLGAAQPGELSDLVEEDEGLRMMLEAAAPPGWRFEAGADGVPTGWRETEAAEAPRGCAGGAFRALQEHGFHRMIGPFVPEVKLWWCAPARALRWDAREDFPARYLGRDAWGRRWFVRQIGRSTWLRAPEGLAAALPLTPPALRHVFRLGPGSLEEGPPASRSRQVQETLRPSTSRLKAPRNPLHPAPGAFDEPRSDQ